MSTRAHYGQAVKAAIYQLKHKMTTKAAAKMFGVKHLSIRNARQRKNIAHPFPRKRKNGIYGQAIKAAIYQLNHKMTTKASAKMFGVNHLSIGHARRRKNIAHPFPRKNNAIQAAKLVLDKKLNIETAIKTYKASRGTISCAVNRMGKSMMELREDRRIFKNRGRHYFRLRTKDKTVLKALSDDIHVARIMRDKLEHELGLSK